MSFIVKTAVANQIVKPKRVAEERKTILERMALTTLDKLEESISDAKGRYVEFKAAKDAERKPAPLWQVVKAAERVENAEGKFVFREADLLNEEVKVWLTVGISKLEIGGPGVVEIVVPASMLISVLEDMKNMVEAARNADGSEASEAFWALAIERAFPPSRPKDEKFNFWEYDQPNDQWVPTFDKAIAKADEIADDEERKLAIKKRRDAIIKAAQEL